MQVYCHISSVRKITPRISDFVYNSFLMQNNVHNRRNLELNSRFFDFFIKLRMPYNSWTHCKHKVLPLSRLQPDSRMFEWGPRNVFIAVLGNCFDCEKYLLFMLRTTNQLPFKLLKNLEILTFLQHIALKEKSNVQIKLPNCWKVSMSIDGRRRMRGKHLIGHGCICPIH